MKSGGVFVITLRGFETASSSGNLLAKTVWHTFESVFYDAVFIASRKLLFVGSKDGNISNSESVLKDRAERFGLMSENFNDVLIESRTNSFRFNEFKKECTVLP